MSVFLKGYTQSNLFSVHEIHIYLSPPQDGEAPGPFHCSHLERHQEGQLPLLPALCPVQ